MKEQEEFQHEIGDEVYVCLGSTVLWEDKIIGRGRRTSGRVWYVAEKHPNIKRDACQIRQHRNKTLQI